MREIASSLGFSKAALYHHFSDKQELLLEVLLAGVEQAGRISAAAVAAEGDTRARVRTLLEGVAQHRQQQRSAMRLAEREAGNLTEAGRAAMFGNYRELFLKPIETILMEGQAAGELTAESDPAWLTRALLALAQPLLSLDSAGSDHAVNATLQLFFDGAGAAARVR